MILLSDLNNKSICNYTVVITSQKGFFRKKRNTVDAAEKNAPKMVTYII